MVEIFEPCILATTIGSLPHVNVPLGTRLMFSSTPELPSWVQFPKRRSSENMMRQFTEGMPGLVEDEKRFYFDSASTDFIAQMTAFFTHYLRVTEDGDPVALDQFAISGRYAAGFKEFVGRLGTRPTPVVALKGQVTGPFTLGINLMDQDERCAYYDDQLRDVIVKTVALKAIWQITKLKVYCDQIIILIDEPSLLNFGSQMFITVTREQIINFLGI